MAVKIDVSAEELLEAGAHFGHQSRRWNPKMAPYLYGVKEGVHIFDLIKTRKAILTALEVLEKAVKQGKTILFLGTKKQAKASLKKVAQKTNYPYVDKRWLGGMLTNFDQLKKSIKTLKEMSNKMAEGEYRHLTKKERLLKAREIDKLEQKFGGVTDLEGLPELMVIIDTHREKAAVREANLKKIPIIGVVDSNADPTLVTYPIPMNDDATRAIDYLLELFEKTILKAKKTGKKKS